MSLSRRSVLGVVGKITLAVVATPITLLVTDGCATQQVETTLRSLEHSGRISFVCLAAPGTTPSTGLPLEDCTIARFQSPDDYAVVDGKTTQPHLYALVTQTTRGEVAVIDMSTKTQAVLDQNPRVPGANFLPIGAQPIDIVSTPDGDATFVGVAEVGRQGIFALPSKDIRACADCAPKTISNWTACALPGAPGRMIIVDDPVENEQIRTSCDGAYEAVREPEQDSQGNYLVDLSRKEKGRPKIVTTIPELGAIAVIDAQTLFDVERGADGKPIVKDDAFVYKHPPGSWLECPIERWVPLEVDVPLSSPPPAGTGGPACVDRPIDAAAPQVAYDSRPAGIAKSAEQLFVADTNAPVIHVLDMKTPCEPIERAPLLPSSLENPNRVVTTNAISVTATLAGSLNQFLYATDDYDGTLMAFDVGPSSISRRPISRPHPEWTPAQPPDRIDYGVPIKDLVLIERDAPQAIPATGITPEGVRCDPDPALKQCTSDSASCDPETLYRTSSNYEKGAGPTRMRGAFAYVVLATGQIAVVDIDDYDAQCRIPVYPSHLNGCTDERILPPAGKPDDTKIWQSSGEASCNVVIPHTPRAATYMRTSEGTGQNQPGLQNFPLFYDHQGVLQSTFDPDSVVLRATLPNPTVKPEQFTLAVASTVFPYYVVPKTDKEPELPTGLIKNGEDLEHAVVANLEDPRGHTSSQSFSVIYEGAIPGFSGKAAKLRTEDSPATLSDAASRFCDQGVLGQNAFKEILRAENPMLTDAEVETQSLKLADYAQISTSVPPDGDEYWTTKDVQCSFEQCNLTFGPLEIPKTTRDLKIVEAYQDHLEIALPTDVVTNVDDPSQSIPVASLVDCCFPSLVSFNVRVGSQWAVLGTNSGFFHHVAPTSSDSALADRPVGACRNTCDTRDARKNGRVRSLPHGTIITDDDPRAFINPLVRFAINEPVNGHPLDAEPTLAKDNAPRRGTFFQFTTQGAFRPLLVNLASSTTEIQPQSIGFVPSTGEVVITDGSLEGIILLSAGRLDVTRRYF